MALTFDDSGSLISGGLDIGQPGGSRYSSGDADSKIQCHIGSIEASAQSFAFGGVDGVFRVPMGKRSRSIAWTGMIRALNDTVMNAIETDVDAYVADAGAYTMEDSWSREFTNVVLLGYERRGRRVVGVGTVGALQPFVLTFVQLSP